MDFKLKSKKLLLVGPTAGSIHLETYYHLISDVFEEILVVTESDITFSKFELLNFSIKKPVNVFKNIKRLKRIIQEFKPDIIHVHQANSCAFITARANSSKIPLIVTAWGSDVLVLPSRSKVLKRMVRYVIKNADLITADAKYMLDAIHELHSNTPTVLVNFGIDYQPKKDLSKEKTIYSNRLHFDLYNIDKIILAFADFVKNNSDWRLVIGARGDNTEKLKELAKEKLPQDSFEFIGFVDQSENNDNYRKSKIWVSIPSSDGTSISLLEAMGNGCIPVVSDLPANREWIDDASNGLLVQNNLNACFQKALEMNLESVQTQNARIIIERATKEVNKNIFIESYRKIGL